MSDKLDENGLEIATRDELLDALKTKWKSIYGDDVNLDSNSPDGQALNIFAQGGVDVRELLMQVYNSMNINRATGSVLDERCALNNIARKGGSFTNIDIDITTDRTVTLQGLDSDYNNIDGTGYTIQDDEGNQFILINTQTLIAGTTRVLFRAKDIGAVETTIGTITTPVTVVLGVISVNNPIAASSIGEDEESDRELKIRRKQSVAKSSYGYLNGLLAEVIALTGVTDAAIYENNTDEEDENGIPAHGIWLVVEGGASSDIANAIYSKKSYGCNLKGSITYNITTPSYQTFTAKWDEPLTQAMYLKFTIKAVSGATTFDEDAIKQYIQDNIDLTIGKYAETSTLTTLIQEAIDNNGGKGYATNVQISTDNSTWVEYLDAIVATKYVLSTITIEVA